MKVRLYSYDMNEGEGVGWRWDIFLFQELKIVNSKEPPTRHGYHHHLLLTGRRTGREMGEKNEEGSDRGRERESFEL
jgi:hypothetical protein